MKPIHFRLHNLLLAAAVIALISPAIPARAEKAAEAKVIRLRGAARYSTDQKKWKTLEVGTILKSGTLIQTAPNCTADICLKEGKPAKNSAPGADETTDNVIRIFENALLSVDQLAKDEIQFDLRAGTLMGTVGKLPTQAKYEIKLPHGIAGIRSGTYIADASGVFNVLDGNAVLVIIGADSSLATKKISTRQGYDPTTGDIVPLHMSAYPQPLTCSGSELPANAPPAGPQRGPGMGGALRRF